MAQPSYAPMPKPRFAPAVHPVSFVIGPQFCASYPVDLVIVEKPFTVTEGNFHVTDVEGNLVFKVKGRSFFLAFHDRRLLIDAAGNRVVTLRNKILTAHSRWEVFKGDSTYAKDLLFSVRTPHVIQMSTKLDVFLANNSTEEVCDFKVEGSGTEKSCVVKAGESSTIIAYMQKIETLGKDKFTVSVHPNVDYAFIVTLILKVEEAPFSLALMAEPSYVPTGHPVAVISPQFCAPYPVDLIIVRKVMTLSDGKFSVTDVNGNIMFKVKGKLLSLRDRRVLLDASDRPVVSLQQKVLLLLLLLLLPVLLLRCILTAHRRWQVFRGDSSDSQDLLFSVKKSSILQFKTELDIFLATNTKEDACDFKVKGSWLERSCVIYLGDSSTIVAQSFPSEIHTNRVMAKTEVSPKAEVSTRTDRCLTCTASTVHVSVIGPQFCVPYPLDLAIVRKVMVLTGGNFVVTDASDNIMLKIEVRSALHDRRFLVDAAGNPIVTLKQKKWSMHSRWQVFRGDSRDDADLLFSAKTSSFIQLKTKLDVFLAENTVEELCDFMVEASWLDRSCTIYAGNSSTIVAQMHKKNTAQSILVAMDEFMVTVYPNVDYAFIVSLIVILDCINREGAEN
ncbi:hypothetical protein RJ640_010312 [Escallonia rubra]|uniref:Protein LURP-one-related 15 n=1 Tax=Escallonia rubra TaxID=112253 RepID=A0AA88UEQ3_9ASTE|nr:hypothetical protein RJ640_010312 [Escallonia rubra]